MALASRCRMGQRRCGRRRNAGLTSKSCIVAVANGCISAQAHADGYGGFAGAGAGLESTAGFALADLDFVAGLWKPRLTADWG